MALLKTSLREITSATDQLSVTLKIIHVWQVSNSKGSIKSINLIYCDDEDDRIEAVISRRFFDQHTPMLFKGKYHLVTGARIVRNNSEYRICSHSFKLQFRENARITVVRNIFWVDRGIIFSPFHEIAKPTINSKYLISIVGKVFKMPLVDIKAEKITLWVMDNSAIEFEVEVTGNHAEHVYNYYHNFSRATLPFYILIQYAKVVKTGLKTTLKDCKDATTIYFSQSSVLRTFKSERMCMREYADSILENAMEVEPEELKTQDDNYNA